MPQPNRDPIVREVNGCRIIIAPFSGFCYGVTRACELAEQALHQHRAGEVHCLGHLIHNPQVVDQMARAGLRVVESLDGIEGGVLIIRSHGIEAQIRADAGRRGMTLIDATCPFVTKAHRAAVRLEEEGYRTVIVGDRHHPEVRGLVSHLHNQPIIIETPDQVPAELAGARVGVIAQTTQAEDNFNAIVAKLRALAAELKAVNTICEATRQRQEAAIRLARSVELMIIIGGRNSANTGRLVALCAETGTPTHHVETEAEIREEWLDGFCTIGLAAGASTPGWLIEQVGDRLATLLQARPR